MTLSKKLFGIAASIAALGAAASLSSPTAQALPTMAVPAAQSHMNWSIFSLFGGGDRDNDNHWRDRDDRWRDRDDHWRGDDNRWGGDRGNWGGDRGNYGGDRGNWGGDQGNYGGDRGNWGRGDGD